jgi:hypothetical protein
MSLPDFGRFSLVVRLCTKYGTALLRGVPQVLRI